MVASYIIQPDDSGNTGKLLQTWVNLVGVNNVHAEAVIAVNSSGVEITSWNVVITSGTLQTLNSGSLQYLGNVGTLPNIVIGSGTIQTLNAGSLQYVGSIGTLPNIVVGSGTLQMLNGGTINTLNSGSLQYVGNVGTLPNIVVGSGTLQAISNALTIGSGTLQTLNNGTLTYVSNIGTVFYQNNLGTVYNINNLGSANTYSKHDLKSYDNAFAQLTASGTIVNAVASKMIKVHQYSLTTDGTFRIHFMDAHLGGGTLDHFWLLNQREGAISPFVPYPGYLFATRAGSALFMGTTAIQVTPAGTLGVHVVYSDDDAS